MNNCWVRCTPLNTNICRTPDLWLVEDGADPITPDSKTRRTWQPVPLIYRGLWHGWQLRYAWIPNHESAHMIMIDLQLIRFNSRQVQTKTNPNCSQTPVPWSELTAAELAPCCHWSNPALFEHRSAFTYESPPARPLARHVLSATASGCSHIPGHSDTAVGAVMGRRMASTSLRL